MSRPSYGSAARLAGGGLILVAVVWRLGTGPVVDGLRSISAWPLVAAAAIGALTTVCAAWRWSLVARELEVALPLPRAIGAYYGSQFLNTALPGGVLGDVHRGVRHGRDVGDLGRGVRAVAWERGAGQLVQIVLALVVLLFLPSPARPAMPVVLALAIALVAVLAILLALPFARGRLTRARSAVVGEGLLVRRSWLGITAASVVIVVGHAATFVIAARTAGSRAPVSTLLPLALLVLLAMVVPVNIGGWGPREGAAAWLFATAGLGADQGVATATVYGVMVLVSCLPGAVVLVVARHRRPPRQDRVPDVVDATWPAVPVAREQVAVHG